MTPKMKQILDNLHQYNMEHLAKINFELAEVKKSRRYMIIREK